MRNNSCAINFSNTGSTFAGTVKTCRRYAIGDGRTRVLRRQLIRQLRVRRRNRRRDPRPPFGSMNGIPASSIFFPAPLTRLTSISAKLVSPLYSRSSPATHLLRPPDMALRAIFIALKMLEMRLGVAATLMRSNWFVAFITLKVRGGDTARSRIISAGQSLVNRN